MITADVSELTRQILAGFKPPPRLRLSEYADEYAAVSYTHLTLPTKSIV